jgi:hypothetical protein
LSGEKVGLIWYSPGEGVHKVGRFFAGELAKVKMYAADFG